MQYSDYKCFRFGFDSGVAFVSIDHPPINLLDEVLSMEFDKLGKELEVDESVRVGVLLYWPGPLAECALGEDCGSSNGDLGSGDWDHGSRAQVDSMKHENDEVYKLA
jgi:hypothetical protein